MSTSQDRAVTARAAAVALLALALLAACSKTTEPSPPAAPSPVPPGASPTSASPAGASVPPAGASAGDPYDTGRMDFKPGPATVTSDRHTGAFAAGDALSMDAMVKPLAPAPVKEIRLDTTHKIIEIAPGVKFSAWTFGDQVPGPVFRVRVGDRIKFSMTNRSDEPASRSNRSASPVIRSQAETSSGPISTA